MSQDFTLLIYTFGGMTGREARATEKQLVKMLGEKWWREY